MNMLSKIPTDDHLSRMYYELSIIGAEGVGEKKRWPYDPRSKEELVALALDMSRFDPRLFGIVVKYFIDRWADLNPLKLRSYYSKMEKPETVGVVCEFFSEVVTDPEALHFSSYLTSGLKPAEPQFYFHNAYAPAGELARRAVEEGLFEFKKWGFFACERPVIDRAGKKTVGSFDGSSRMNILKELAESNDEIGIGNYLSAVHHSISRQQALLDIKAAGLVPNGKKGRGAKWKLAA